MNSRRAIVVCSLVVFVFAIPSAGQPGVVQIPLDEIDDEIIDETEPPQPEIVEAARVALERARREVAAQRRAEKEKPTNLRPSRPTNAARSLWSIMRPSRRSREISDESEVFRVATKLLDNGEVALPPLRPRPPRPTRTTRRPRRTTPRPARTTPRRPGGPTPRPRPTSARLSSIRPVIRTTTSRRRSQRQAIPSRLTDEQLRSLNMMQRSRNDNFNITRPECTPNPRCDPLSKYRTYTGWCNNLRVPRTANVFNELRRELNRNAYDDGRGTPRSRGTNGRRLPSPREISNWMHRTGTMTDDPTYSHMLMQFAQEVTHDIVFTPNANHNDPSRCSSCSSSSTSRECAPIAIPNNDPFFDSRLPNRQPKCLPFIRSLDGSPRFGSRNQINQVRIRRECHFLQNTPFLDGSFIYGSTDCDAAQLRLNVSGLLNFTEGGSGTTLSGSALPQGNQERNCMSAPQFPCFVAGDARNNLHPGLQTLHIVFLREHNRIARLFAMERPEWDDERLYQESRRLVIAQLQHITYNEMLPRLLGEANMDKYNLRTQENGEHFTGYLDYCDASTMQGFATAAFRFGHTMVQPNWPILNRRMEPIASDLKLGDNFLHTNVIYALNGVAGLITGLLKLPAALAGRFASSAVRDEIFSNPTERGSGNDLISLNIMRGRDHGIPEYNAYRVYAGLQRARNFDGLLTEMEPAAVDALASAYATADDIDLFTGIVSETPSNGALMGPTGQALIGEQFQRLKQCDRFYYENNDPVVGFTQQQLSVIHNITLSTLIGNNMPSLFTIQPSAFDVPDPILNPINTPRKRGIGLPEIKLFV